MNAAYANRTIPLPYKGVQLKKKKYGLHDIARVCYNAVKNDQRYMREFAKAFSPDMEGLKSLFEFFNRHFKYQEDPAYSSGAVQAIQSPQWLWHKTKTGDCKSFTNFIACTVLGMGLPVILRLVDYGIPNEKHIYPLAVLGKKKIPLDVVYKKQQGGGFGQEKRYRRKLKDIIMQPISAHVKQPGLYKVGATSHQPTPQQLWNAVLQLEGTVEQDIPSDIIKSGGGDVTLMTNGQLDRLMAIDRFRVFARTEPDPKLAEAYNQAAAAIETGSIGSVASSAFGKRLGKFIVKTARDNKPAFENFTIAIPKPADPNQEITVDGIGKIRIGKFFKKVVSKVTDLFKKVVNWIFKGAGKKMGPYFLFITAGATIANKISKSKEVRRRMGEQKKAFAWIAKKGKFSESKLKSLAATGIREELGGTPDQVVQHYLNSKVGAIPAAVAAAPKVIGAMGMVVQVIKKIAGLFKKKETLPEINKDNASDPFLLEELEGTSYEQRSPGQLPRTELETMKRGKVRIQRKPADGNGGGGGLAIVAAIAALLLAT